MKREAAQQGDEADKAKHIGALQLIPSSANWREEPMWTGRGQSQSLDAAADALSQDIIENVGSHLNHVKESRAEFSFADYKEEIVLLEVLAFEYFLMAHAALCTQLERQDELLIRIADKLWIYLSSRQSRFGERLAFQEFLDHRLMSYKTRLGEEDFLVRVADTLLENIFPDQPQDGGLLAYFAMIAGSTAIANKRFFDRLAEKIKLV